MLKYDKREGYSYIDEQTGKEFPLLALHSLGGTTTSDIVVIWDEEHNNIFNWFYGESYLPEEPEAIENIVADYIRTGNRI